MRKCREEHLRLQALRADVLRRGPGHRDQPLREAPGAREGEAWCEAGQHDLCKGLHRVFLGLVLEGPDVAKPALQSWYL